MILEPINDDHAIEEVVFGCILNRRILPADVRQLISLHDGLADELPAVAGGDDPPNLQFSYFRPNGTATWALLLADGSVAVSCTRYTRWDRVWASAQQYLLVGLGALRDSEKTAATATALTITDRFQARSDPPSVANLLVPSDLLMPGAFTIQSDWHSRVGWFDEAHLGGKVLNHVNIDLRREPFLDTETRQQQLRPTVTVVHVQQFRPDAPLDVAKLAEAGGCGPCGRHGLHARSE
jgi:hypothetical protein